MRKIYHNIPENKTITRQAKNKVSKTKSGFLGNMNE
jgi:hypothetical protein